MSLVAWIGGSSPQPIMSLCRGEARLVRALFRDQMAIHRDYWGNVKMDTARIFWGRARGDAHATMRNGQACVRCGDLFKPTEHTTGYGQLNGNRYCFRCCGDLDRAGMLATGRAALYFTDGVDGPRISNWPSTLIFSVREYSRFNHPFAREAWRGTFIGPDGVVWRFQNIGDSQIAHCKRAGDRAQPRQHRENGK